MFRLLLLPFLMLATAGETLAQSDAPLRASGWVQTASSQVRLILPQTFRPGEAVHGGLEVRMEPGAKTYWRSPGETGVAPVLDLSASRGLRSGSLLYPVPVAFDDGAGGTAVGYTESLIFPLALTAEGTAAPMISARFDFGVCHRNMCMPASAAFTIKPGDGEADPSLSTQLSHWLARVPSRSDLAGLAIARLSEQRTGDTLTLRADVKAPATGGRSLFVEAEGLMFTTRIIEDGKDGSVRFEAVSPLPSDLASRPTGPVTVTLTAGATAIERTIVPQR